MADALYPNIFVTAVDVVEGEITWRYGLREVCVDRNFDRDWAWPILKVNIRVSWVRAPSSDHP